MTSLNRGLLGVGGDLWITNSTALVTGRPEDPVKTGVELVIEGGVITYLGSRDRHFQERILHRLDQCEVLDASGCVIYPGLVNTHHHMYQVMTRNHPDVEGLGLFGWLERLFPMWTGVTEELAYYTSLLAMAELVQFGCTTTMDHHYVFPKGQLGCLDRQFEAAERIGIRFHGSRGSMSVGHSRGGLPQDDLVEDPDTVLAESERLIRTYHDPHPFSMRQVVLSPCAPTSVDAALFRETADLARRYGVRMHTHLAETMDEITYSREKFGRSPVEYMDDVGWLGPDVWFAHAVHLDGEDIRRLAEAGVGVAHCASSNMKLHSGICPVHRLYRAGVFVGLGVDGSASNDSSNLLAELRTAYLLQQLAEGPEALTAREMLALAGTGGARLLGREELGVLEVGKAGDCFLLNIDRAEYAGSGRDWAAMPATQGIHRPVDATVVAGKVIYRDGNWYNGFHEKEVIHQFHRLLGTR